MKYTPVLFGHGCTYCEKQLCTVVCTKKSNVGSNVGLKHFELQTIPRNQSGLQVENY